MSSTAARPKRASELFARTLTSERARAAKKPRFDARNPSTLAADEAPREEGDDVVLDADVVGAGGGGGGGGVGTKRRAVQIDGYESDSDEGGFEVRDRDRVRGGGEGGRKEEEEEEEEEEEDMFADLEGKDGDAEVEEVDGAGKKGSKKEVRFLDRREIEGQVMNSRSGGRVAAEWLEGAGGKGKGKARRAEEGTDEEEEEEEEQESSSDEEQRARVSDGDEDAEEVGAGGKKRHAPRLDAFNLKDEEEEGRFDESGNFVRKAVDPDAANDNWLHGVSKRDVRRAREAQERRDQEQRRKTAESDALLSSDLLSTLIGNLETGETALEALQRLAKSKDAASRKKKGPKPWWRREQEGEMDVDEAGEAEGDDANAVKTVEASRRKTVEVITGAADALYSRDQPEIYDTEREMLIRQYRRETGEDWRPMREDQGGHDDADEDAMWEYRWSDARDGHESHGPYDGATMKAWNDAGYFGDGVEFRRAGGVEWSRILEVK